MLSPAATIKMPNDTQQGNHPQLPPEELGDFRELPALPEPLSLPGTWTHTEGVSVSRMAQG